MRESGAAVIRKAELHFPEFPSCTSWAMLGHSWRMEVTVVTLSYIFKRSGQGCQAILQLMPLSTSDLAYFTAVG